MALVPLPCLVPGCTFGPGGSKWETPPLEFNHAMQFLDRHIEVAHHAAAPVSPPSSPFVPPPVVPPVPTPTAPPEVSDNSAKKPKTEEGLKLSRLKSNSGENCILHRKIIDIDALIKDNKHILDSSRSDEICQKTIKVMVKPGTERQLSLSDIEKDVCKKFNHWDRYSIVVPSSDFPGVSERMIWTDEDIVRGIREKYAELRKWCNDVISTNDTNKIKEEFQGRFGKLNSDITGMSLENINVLSESLIEKFLRKKNADAFSSLGKICGNKAELENKKSNINFLQNGTGLVLTGLKNFKHLGKMMKEIGIDIGQDLHVSKEVENDLIRILPTWDKLEINFEEVKSILPKGWFIENNIQNILQKKIEKEDWYHVNDSRDVVNKIQDHIIDAFDQLEKDIVVFKTIFGFLSKKEWDKIKINFTCSLPCNEVPECIQICEECKIHIKSKHHFDVEKEQTHGYPRSVGQEVLHIYRKLLGIYLGVGSMIEQKILAEGYNKERDNLQNVSECMFDYKTKKKIVMQGPEQIRLNYTNLKKVERGCVVFGPYGSGKTDSLIYHFEKIYDSICEKKNEKFLIVFLIFDEKALDLKQFFSNIVGAKPNKENLEIEIQNKSQALTRFGIDEQDLKNDPSTSDILNLLCKKYEATGEKFEKIFLLVDEVSIMNHEGSLLGTGPFESHGKIFEWSKLTPPEKVHLFVAVTPESENFLEKHNFIPESEEAQENKRNNVLPTFLLPRVYRSTREIQDLIQNLQTKCEYESITAYTIDTESQVHGHEVIGDSPLWMPVKSADHLKCNKKDCSGCFLNREMKKKLQNLISSITSFIPAEDIAIIISTYGFALKKPEKIRTKKWLEKLLKSVPTTLKSMELLIPNEFVGSIIGIGGRNIKRLELENNCRIKGSNFCTVAGHKQFTITGRLEHIQNVEKAIHFDIAKTTYGTKATDSSWLRESDGVKIKFDFEFEGMESPVVIAMINNGDVRRSISNSLSRANDRLIIISPDEDALLDHALSAKKLNWIGELRPSSSDKQKVSVQKKSVTFHPNIFKSEKIKSLQHSPKPRGTKTKQISPAAKVISRPSTSGGTSRAPNYPSVPVYLPMPVPYYSPLFREISTSSPSLTVNIKNKLSLREPEYSEDNSESESTDTSSEYEEDDIDENDDDDERGSSSSYSLLSDLDGDGYSHSPMFDDRERMDSPQNNDQEAYNEGFIEDNSGGNNDGGYSDHGGNSNHGGDSDHGDNSDHGGNSDNGGDSHHEGNSDHGGYSDHGGNSDHGGDSDHGGNSDHGGYSDTGGYSDHGGYSDTGGYSD